MFQFSDFIHLNIVREDLTCTFTTVRENVNTFNKRKEACEVIKY